VPPESFAPPTPSTTTTKRIRAKSAGSSKADKVKKQILFEEGVESDTPLQRKRSKLSGPLVMPSFSQGEVDLLKTENLDLKTELQKVRAERDDLLKQLGPAQLALGEAKGELKGIREMLALKK
jgi:SMC interacting uncharacterized protein involved in chromosome segregation